MAKGGTTVATAYVQVEPTTTGIKDKLTEQMGGEVQEAGNDLGTKLGSSLGTSMSQSMQNFGKDLTSIGGTAQKIGGTLTKSLTLPITGAAGASIKLASDFESSMAKVSTLTDGSASQLAEMRSQIVDVSNEYGVSASEVAEATYQAISAGQSAGDAVNFVSKSLGLAKAGFTSATTATDTMTTVLNAYGMSADQATHVSDTLITAQNLGKTTVDELGASMGRVIPTASMAGVSFEQLSSAFVTTTKNGISTAESSTYINGMLNELAKSGSTASDALKDKTGKSFQELMADGASLTDVLGILNQSAQESGMSITDMFGSQEAGKAAATLVQHADDFNGAVKAMGNNADTTANALAKIDATPAEQMEKSLTQLKNLGIEIGTTVIPMVQPFVQNLTDKVKDLSAKWNSLSDSEQQNIIKIAGIVAAVGPLITVFGKLTSSVGSIATFAGKAVGGISSLASHFGSLGSKAGTAVSKAAEAGSKVADVGSKAGSAAGGISSAASGFGQLAGQALKIVAVGAALALVGVGIKLIADSAVNIANAGPDAGIAMAAMAVGIAAMAAVAAILGPALTASAVGLVAFGAGVTLVGVGILAATAGITLLSTQLPTISQYGGSAAGALGELALSIAAVGGGALVAAGGVTAMILPMVGGAVSVTVFAGAMTLMAGSMTLAAGGTKLLETALKGSAKQLKSIATDSNTAEKNIKKMNTSLNSVKEGFKGTESSISSFSKKLTGAFKGDTLKKSTKSMMKGMETEFKKGSSNVLSAQNSLADELSANTSKMMNRTRLSIKLSLAQIAADFKNTKLSFNQNIALPHFSLSGNFNAKTGKVPATSVSWYKSAMTEPVILDQPTIFGMQGGNLLGAGEAGSEVVSGTDKLAELIRQNTAGNVININVYGAEGQPIDEIADEIEQRITNKISVKKAVFA